MTDPATYPITHKWPAAHPERLPLYSLANPNRVKVSIMFEEIGLPYTAHLLRCERFGKARPVLDSALARPAVQPRLNIPARH